MSSAGLRIGILGATGAVGRQMRRCLQESPVLGHAVNELRLFASARTAGSVVEWPAPSAKRPSPQPSSGDVPGDSSLEIPSPLNYVVAEPSARGFDGLDILLVSAGAAASGEWAPSAVRAGAWVIDNSSRFRMEPEVPLIVPEINGHRIPRKPAIIANPNCSTIQMVMALAPLHRMSALQRVLVSTYQSASGSGAKGVQELNAQVESLDQGLEDDPRHGPDSDRLDDPTTRPGPGPVFPRVLFGNVIPQCDVFLDDGYTREEEKMIRETRKILELPRLIVQPTCVRVPVAVGHSEAVYVETAEPLDLEELRDVWAKTPGLRVEDDPSSGRYPTPRQAAGTDEVWIGRLRRDRDVASGLHFWVVSDNLRKGAATNAVQIAEALWTRMSVPAS